MQGALRGHQVSAGGLRLRDETPQAGLLPELPLVADGGDGIVLDMLEGEVLGTKFVEELLGMVDHGQMEDRSRLAADRERLRGEVENLIRSIAAGVPTDTVAPGIRARELEISRLEVRLRAPLPEAPRIEELREALLQRAEDWRKTLRAEPHVARVLVRRLIGPLVLYDESTRPDFIKADAEVKPGLLDGLVPHSAYNRMASPGNGAGDVYTGMASPMPASWNQIASWLNQIDGLRQVA